MNQAQVLDAWRLDRLRRDREAAAARRWAVERVAAHPELCDESGEPCSFAIDAALHYRRLGGAFGVDVVRRHRDMRIARLTERLGAA